MRSNQLGKKIQNSGGFPATEMSPQYSLPIPSVYCLEIWIVFHKCGESTLFSRHIISVLLEEYQVWNVCISCVFSRVQPMWFHKSQRWHGGHFMTAGPAKEGVTQENQTVITALCPVFIPVLNLLYFTVHSWMAGHHEKKQTVITALCPDFSLLPLPNLPLHCVQNSPSCQLTLIYCS